MPQSLLRALQRLLLAVAATAVLASCAGLPSQTGRSVSTFLPQTGTTTLDQAIQPNTAAHPGLTGIYALPGGMDSFAARVLLANSAQRSLDVQYYIWHKDITGTLLFNALRAAAERGVRVRLLLDDNNTSGLDPTLALLEAHPNIEVRLFNPFVNRSLRPLAYLTDFFRLNRRMHNKSFTADNEATIIGGRNVGDEYFGAAGDVLFSDLDVVAVGPAVQAVSADFDKYWNSASAYPLRAIVRDVPAESAAASLPLDAEAAAVGQSPAGRTFLEALRVSPFAAQLVQHKLPLQWATARLVSDDPAKGLGKADEEHEVKAELARLIGEPTTSLELVSPYFVPGKKGADAFAAMAQRGVKVRILTNSFEATDVAAVHAGYEKRRKELLEAGVQLYEMRAQWAASSERESAGPFGSSASSLHAKTFAVDGQRIFVGSFNFDPRSARLNTEMGFVIDCPALALQLKTRLDERLPVHAYEVRLNPDGSLYWVAHDGDKESHYATEPGTNVLKRFGIGILSHLPIDWLL